MPSCSCRVWFQPLSHPGQPIQLQISVSAARGDVKVLRDGVGQQGAEPSPVLSAAPLAGPGGFACTGCWSCWGKGGALGPPCLHQQPRCCPWWGCAPSSVPAVPGAPVPLRKAARAEPSVRPSRGPVAQTLRFPFLESLDQGKKKIIIMYFWRVSSASAPESIFLFPSFLF